PLPFPQETSRGFGPPPPLSRTDSFGARGAPAGRRRHNPPPIIPKPQMRLTVHRQGPRLAIDYGSLLKLGQRMIVKIEREFGPSLIEINVAQISGALGGVVRVTSFPMQIDGLAQNLGGLFIVSRKLVKISQNVEQAGFVVLQPWMLRRRTARHDFMDLQKPLIDAFQRFGRLAHQEILLAER